MSNEPKHTATEREYLQEIGVRIRKKRNELKMSFPKLSELTNIEQSNLWRIEMGKNNFRILTIEAIAKAFGCKKSDLL